MGQKIHQFIVDSTQIFETLSSTSDDYIYIWDYQGGNYVASKNLTKDFAIPSEGTNFIAVWQTFVHKKDIARVETSIQEAVEQKKTKINIEYQVTNANGEHIWISDKASIRYDKEGGVPIMIVGVMHNLLYDGAVDSIAGLFMHSRYRDKFEVLKNNQLVQTVTVMIIGIDGFASINTLHNHRFGDLVLRKTAQDFLEYLDDANMYRYDGDQFLIVSEKFTKEEMIALYEKFKSHTKKAHQVEGISYRFSISAGIANYPEDASSWVDLEKAVSLALKKAKETGKNNYALFSNKIYKEAIFEQNLTRQLSNSVERNCANFNVVYQPICHTQNLRVHGAEILLRYKSPNDEAVFPDVFIPLLEQTRLIIPVGLWVLEQAIRTCKKWISFIPDFVMSVNVSYLQLRESSFCEQVEHLLKKYDLDASHLTLELTESYFITDAKRIEKTIQRLHELQINLAMDDFGTGYSSLARLSEFAVDIVKIDRSFVQSLHQSKYNHDFVDSVVRLCHNVGMIVCVEGVETQDEQEIINVLNADYVQGYYVSRPILEDDFYESFIKNLHANDDLVVTPNKQLQRDQLVSDNDVLTAMMDATPLGLNFWNRDYEIIACNAEIIHLLGAKDVKDVQENFMRFSPKYQADGKLSRNKVHEVIESAFHGKRVRFYWDHYNPLTKEVIPTDVTAVCIPYMNKEIVATYAHDLREQRRMEEKIHQFNSQLKAILNSNPLCLNLWNKDFANLMCNTAAVELFGLKNQEEYLERFFELSPEYQPNGVLSSSLSLEYITSAFEKGYCQFKWMHQDLQGNEIPAEITLVKIQGFDEFGNELVAGYTRDLREQLAMEEKIEKFNTRLEALLDSSPLCLNLWNRNFENIMCNEAAVSLFNLDKQEEYLQHFFELSPKYQPDGMLSSEKSSMYIVNAFKDGYQQFKWMHCDLQGNEIPAEITLVRIDGLDEDGGDLVAGYTRDIRSQLNAEKLQNAVNIRTRAVLDSSPLGCVLWSTDVKIIDCNQVMLQILGAKNTDELRDNFDAFLPRRQPDGEDSLQKKMAVFEELKDKHSDTFEWVYVNCDREEVPCEVSLMRITLEGEEIIVSYSRDLRELHRTLELNDRLSQMAYYDLLTGVTSRARFTERLSSTFSHAKRDQEFTIIFFDIDYFKSVNDKYGHGTGDLVLKRVAKAIEKILPSNAVLGRYGGDEFIILLEKISEEELALLMERVVDNVSNMAFKYEDKEFTTSISMGATFNLLRDESYQNILNRADKALYKAKDGGRNSYAIIK